MRSQYILEYMLRNDWHDYRKNAALIFHGAYTSYTEMVRVRIDNHHHYKTETKSWAVY
jgi:hypothetical protein